MWKVACVILGGGTLVCAQAGVWQLRRMKWKEELVAQRDASLHLPPVPITTPFPWLSDSSSNWEYRRVSVSGRFVHNKEMRMMRVQADQPGYKLYTPLVLGDGSVLIVGRGWVPAALADWRKRTEATGDVTVEGVLRVSDPQGKYTPANLPTLNEWHYANLAEMTAFAGLSPSPEPYYLQCVDFNTRTVYGFDVSAGPVPDKPGNLMTWWATPETHMSYALFWFSSSFVCLWFLVRTFRFRYIGIWLLRSIFAGCY